MIVGIRRSKGRFSIRSYISHMDIKYYISHSNILKPLYRSLKKVNDAIHFRKATHDNYRFEDRQNKSQELMIIIAGYKDFLYADVFSRAEKYIPKSMDVVIVSSGKYDDDLSEIAKKNGWSYLGTRTNSVTLVQNIAILLHPAAKLIFKMDEDIFLTQGCIETMKSTYKKVYEEGLYDIGFVAPILPINGYSHISILRQYNLIGIYEKMFEQIKYASYATRQIESNPKVAKFFWGEGGYVPHIDDINRELQRKEFKYSVCPIRFSIGCICFSRQLWEEMGMWEVIGGNNLGVDERQIAKYCIYTSHAIIISENTVVGHFSFGKQTESMKEYYKEHHEMFSIKEETGKG